MLQKDTDGVCPEPLVKIGRVQRDPDFAKLGLVGKDGKGPRKNAFLRERWFGGPHELPSPRVGDRHFLRIGGMHEILGHVVKPAEIRRQQERCCELGHELAGLFAMGTGAGHNGTLLHEISIRPDKAHGGKEPEEDEENESLSYADSHVTS